ncbi:hypothetical protein [Pseudomonas sp. SWRI77]|uniref:hypothetical protein n=1 Tax=Pseudomonas sp. SWRI77 TaxID=2745485 RepID=UPI0016497931|nr:hypothetical protein [Pseudomonas sp. SWRI77]MBC3480265.1 hypothetical protein [Pseudomonas sp. SWRI77]
MATIYGLRTKDASARITLDTGTTPIRSLKMLQVTCNGSFEQTFSVPEIKSDSFVVVDRLAPVTDPTTNWSPQAWYSAGQLTIRRGFNETWQVLVLSSGGAPFSASGEYGIRSVTNSFQSQIDSVNRVLNVMYQGSFTFPAWRDDQPYLNGFNFPTPITTVERPLVFFNGPGHLLLQNFYVQGTPGNWTGWRVAKYAHPDLGPVWMEAMKVDWFVASYSASPVPAGSYGATVSDSANVRIFTSTNNIVQLNNQPASNSFVVAGTPIVNVGYYATSCQMPWTNNASDYFLGNALLTPTYVPGAGTAWPWRATIGGFLNGRRDVLQAYTENNDGINPVDPNGRTLFAARPNL